MEFGESPHEPWGGAGIGPLGLCMCCADEDGVELVERAAVTASALPGSKMIGVLCVRVGNVSLQVATEPRRCAWRAALPCLGGASEHPFVQYSGAIHTSQHGAQQREKWAASIFYEELHEMPFQATVLHAEEYI